MDERRRNFLNQNLDKARQAKREIAQLRQEMKDGVVDPYVLLRGDDERWEGRVAGMQVYKVLLLLPGIGPSRAVDVLVALDIAPSSKLGTFTYQRREKLADRVRDVREVFI